MSNSGTPPLLKGSTIASQVSLASRLLNIQREEILSPKHPHHYHSEAEKIVASLPPKVPPPVVFGAFLAYEARRAGKTIACEQTPRNVLFIKEILALFPNAFIINMIRDPRDVLLSQKNKWRQRFLTQQRRIPISETIRNWTNYHPITMSLLWNANINAASQFQKEQRLLSIKFEALLEKPEEYVAQICRVTGLEYQPEMLLVSQVGSSHGRDTLDAKGVNPEMAGRWKSHTNRDAADLFICQLICRNNMYELGYPVQAIHANLISVVLEGLLWPLKALLSILFNLSRSKNILRSVQRRLR